MAHCKQIGGLIFAGAATLALLAGCRLPEFVSAKILRRERPAEPQYNTAHFIYEMDGRFRTLPLDDDRLMQASYESGPGGADKKPERWTVARLTIHYPHPEGLPHLARATLRLSGQRRDGPFIPPTTGDEGELPADAEDAIARSPLTNAERDDEIWVLDFPRQQLDLLIDELRSAGYFTAQQRTQPGTQLEVEIDRAHTQKSWTPEPRLDEFVSRVRNEGTLIGFVSERLAATKD